MFEVAHVGVPESGLLRLAVVVHKVFKVVALLNLLLGDQMAVIDQGEIHQILELGQPCQLELCLFDVARKVELARHCSDSAVRPLDHTSDKTVAPVHEGHLLTLLHRRCVRLVKPQLAHHGGGLLPRRFALFVARYDLDFGAGWAVGKSQGYLVLGQHGGVSRAHRVNHLLVDGPEFVPLHVVAVLGGALAQDELLERFHLHAAPRDALHRGEPRVRPAWHAPRVHEPLQLALGEHRVHKVEPRVLPDVHLPDAHELLHPLELRVAVGVLGGAQGVRHPLRGVHVGAGAVVRWVELEAGARLVVRREVASERHRVAQRLVLVLHVHLEARAALLPARAARHHLLPQRLVLIHRVVARFGLRAHHALLTHLLGRRVVDVHGAFLDELLAHL
mmetsp:Transcript_45127/g.86310  ORF Transcript_45127/g.86310 Transcript_45127/m.86310 type:complete len:390 (-) Transcript_45127:963-2132(-)